MSSMRARRNVCLFDAICEYAICENANMPICEYAIWGMRICDMRYAICDMRICDLQYADMRNKYAMGDYAI